VIRLVRVIRGLKSRGYFGEAAETYTRAACAPHIRDIRSLPAVAGHPWLSAPSLIRVYSCRFVVSSQKRRQVAALQSASRETREIRVIRGSLENRKKFSLNPVEGISTSASCAPAFARGYGGQAHGWCG
jgi:hypothetical protein